MSINVMNKITNIGGSDKSMWLIDYKKDKAEVKKLPDSIHHIQILDRSSSMYHSIEQLMEDCKKTILQMKDNDFYTVIWFSSAGEYRTVLKGIKNDEANREASFRVLDSLKSVLDYTCFSESVEETEKIVDELAALCPNFSVTLFTDGCAVTPWSTANEHNRVKTVLERLKDKILAFNTIGYGNYCDEEVLNEWASISNFGQFIHSGKIDEYHTIFEENAERARNLEKDSVEFEVKGADIYYFTSNNVSKYHEKVSLNHIDKKTNQFIIINDGGNLTGTINGDDFTDDGKKSIPANRMDALMYKLALAEYCFGDRYTAICILGKSLADKPMTDAQIAAFTPDEIEKFKKKLKNAAFRNKDRNKGTAPANYVPDENTPCLINLLSILTQSKDNLYVVNNNYKRIGRVTTDSFNMFKKKYEENTSPIENIVYNASKLNISIGFNIPGTVSLNPKQAKAVGLNPEHECGIFRNHTIVKDGYLNMDELKVIVNERTRDDIMKYFDYAVTSIEGKDGKNYLTIDLTQIPIVNAGMGNATIEDMFELVRKENKYKAQIKLAKELTKDSKKTWEQTKYTDEQCALLEEYSIKNGTYNGINNSVPSVEDSDFYMARCCEFTLKGFSKLSSIKIDEDGNPTIEKPANGDAYLVQAISHKNDFTSEVVLDALKALLADTRAKIAGIKIAKVLCGKWFDPEKLADTKKDEVKTYTGHDKDLDKDLVMNIKTTYEKCYF